MYSLVIEVLSLAVDLVLQSKIKGDMFHFLLDKNFGQGCILLFLQVLDHVGKPDCQTVVAEGIGQSRKRWRLKYMNLS